MRAPLLFALAVGLSPAAATGVPAQELKERATLKGHDGPVRCVAFAPDGKTLASGRNRFECSPGKRSSRSGTAVI